MDVYRKIKPNTSDRKLVMMGRLFTGLIVIIGILWIPLIRHMSSQIYQYLQSVQAYISPPITAVFLMGITWKATTGKAAIITLVTGGVIGLGRFVLDLVSKSNDIGVFQFIVEIPFLNFCVYMFVVCIILLVIISKITTNPQSKLDQISSITIGKGVFSFKGESNRWNLVNIIFSLAVALTVILLWSHFS
jgi:SSS family solute:Na+ symporter